MFKTLKRCLFFYFNQRFEDRESIIEYFDLPKIKRFNSKEQIIAIDFPFWMIEILNQKSQRLNLTLPVIVKGWLGEKLISSNSVQTTR